jgi:hypothetical protein
MEVGRYSSSSVYVVVPVASVIEVRALAVL